MQGKGKAWGKGKRTTHAEKPYTFDYYKKIQAEFLAAFFSFFCLIALFQSAFALKVSLLPEDTTGKGIYTGEVKRFELLVENDSNSGIRMAEVQIKGNGIVFPLDFEEKPFRHFTFLSMASGDSESKAIEIKPYRADLNSSVVLKYWAEGKQEESQIFPVMAFESPLIVQARFDEPLVRNKGSASVKVTNNSKLDIGPLKVSLVSASSEFVGIEQEHEKIEAGKSVAIQGLKYEGLLEGKTLAVRVLFSDSNGMHRLEHIVGQPVSQPLNENFGLFLLVLVVAFVAVAYFSSGGKK